MPRFISIFLVFVLLITRAGADENLPRTWTNSLGVKMEATFVDMQGNKVTLLFKNGQMATMPVGKLSTADQAYIHDLELKAAFSSPSTQQQNIPDAPATPAPAPVASQGAPPAASVGKSILMRPGVYHAPDPRVQPKAEIYVPFPELGKSRNGDEPMGMRIRIPADYSPDHPVPLMVWLAGGDGNNRFNAAETLVDQEQFVLVGLNYPAAVPEPQFATMQGKIGDIWALQEKMLAKLQDMIPNIDPRLRIIAGFSNGAHVIGGCLAQHIDGLSHYFNVFILIEGGDSTSFNYPQLPGRYFYIASGGIKNGTGREFNAKLADYARKAGMKVEAHIMEDTGHDFPDSEQARVNSWLQNEVIPAQLAKP